MVLTPWGPENSQTSLCTPTSAHIPTIAFLSPFLCLKKREETKGIEVKKKELWVELP
jgi:hypothetical protein